MIQQYDPTGIFEQNPSKGGIITPKPFYLAGAVANNQTLVAGVSGKKIYVTWMRLKTGNNAGNGVCVFKSASGGTALTTFISCPLDNQDAEMWPPVLGHFWLITNAGEGLFVDITAQGVNITGQYIEVTP